MLPMIKRNLLTASGVLAFAMVVAGCEQTDTALEPTANALVTDADVNAGTDRSATVDREIAMLRRATARFHRFEEAQAAGHTVLVSHPVTGATCLYDPEAGGMGRHYLNVELFPNDELSVTQPEVVLYEPMPNGKLRLVGFEYVVPYSVKGPDETPPTLLGQEFLHNETFGLWMLHVYAWKNNPDGMFSTWNPTITCEHNDAVDG